MRKTDGKSTIDILANTKKILQIINSKEPGSLGLHPIIYFYSKKGNFKPANFYAIILLIRELKQKIVLTNLQIYEKTLKSLYIKMIIYLSNLIAI